jgi:GTPase SAR1 family protein
VTDRSTFEELGPWLTELRRAMGVPAEGVPAGGPREELGYRRNGLVVALAGNKVDLTTGTVSTGIRGEDLSLPPTNQRQVSTKEGKELAEKEGMLFFETSAKIDGDAGAEKLFEDVVFWCNVKSEREAGARGIAGGGKGSQPVELQMPAGSGGCCG